MKPKILVVDDDQAICLSLRTLFEEKGFEVDDIQEGQPAINLFKGKKEKAGKQYQVVLLDVQLPDVSGLKVLDVIRDASPETAVIIITGFGSVPQSVEAMHKGAADYVLKPFNVDEILLRVNKAMDAQKLSERVGFLEEQVYGAWDSKYVQGPNAQMKKLFSKVETVAQSPSTTVLVLGETGTGKEVVATRIHQLSDRAKMPFVAVNASAFSGELLESELFGHEAGAFTGASTTKKGLMEVANGGTLFLDEIGDMDMRLQVKILRVLQERMIRRVGGLDNIPVDIRLVAATHRNLEKMVEEGEFREDLYYRLNVIPLEVPPLRDRPDDIETLVMHFIGEFNKEFGRKVKRVEPAALEVLCNHSWPGNVRELRNMVERTMLLECDGDTLELRHLKLGSSFRRKASTAPSTSDKQRWENSLGTTVPLETIERQHIEGVLETTNGNKNQAAQILGIDRTTLYNKLKKYQITGN